VRGLFQVKPSEPEAAIAQKLDAGLGTLGLRSAENLGLALNLLGLAPPSGALAGLDGVLIGLRTRDLLQNMLEARCRLSPVVLITEDLHWIDGVSQEVLGRIIEGAARHSMLILHTRRPGYDPPWQGSPAAATLQLEALSSSAIRRLVETRLGVTISPDDFARQVTDRAEGNPLFAEEILAFLVERGAVRVVGADVEFDHGATAAALPASLQGLLAARVDGLPPTDRKLLQAASVVGRRFDPGLLAAVAENSSDIDKRLAAMQALDLVFLDGQSGEYFFKHALVLDALYQSLLTVPRMALHFRIGEEIERRNGNRMAEVAEVLAHHYRAANRDEKAFVYLAMAGAKALRVYSVDEAEKHLASAIALVDKDPGCASDEQVAALLVGYTRLSNLLMRFHAATTTVDRFRPRVEILGANADCVLVQHHYVFALTMSGRFHQAARAQSDLDAAAEELGDPMSKAYALISAVHLSPFLGTYSASTFDSLSRQALSDASTLNDSYLQFLLRHSIVHDMMLRGRITEAHTAAVDLVEEGRRVNDPGSLSYGLTLMASVEIIKEDYPETLRLAETSLNVARTPYDKVLAENTSVIANVLARIPEGLQAIGPFVERCRAKGWNGNLAFTASAYGVALILQGQIGRGLKQIDQSSRHGNRRGIGRSPTRIGWRLLKSILSWSPAVRNRL
jgi:hypothetical protein